MRSAVLKHVSPFECINNGATHIIYNALRECWEYGLTIAIVRGRVYIRKGKRVDDKGLIVRAKYVLLTIICRAVIAL